MSIIGPIKLGFLQPLSSPNVQMSKSTLTQYLRLSDFEVISGVVDFSLLWYMEGALIIHVCLFERGQCGDISKLEVH